MSTTYLKEFFSYISLNHKYLQKYLPNLNIYAQTLFTHNPLFPKSHKSDWSAFLDRSNIIMLVFFWLKTEGT